jgi:hypothetical protein
MREDVVSQTDLLRQFAPLASTRSEFIGCFGEAIGEIMGDFGRIPEAVRDLNPITLSPEALGPLKRLRDRPVMDTLTL